MDVGKIGNLAIATIVGFGALFLSDNFWTTRSPASFVMTQAEARIGRPLTPFSIAGVARRTTRRAVWAGAVAGGALGYGYGSYPYGYSYPSYGYSYPSYGYSYPSYGYSYPSYGYSYPSYGYGYGYPSYGYRYRTWWY